MQTYIAQPIYIVQLNVKCSDMGLASQLDFVKLYHNMHHKLLV